MFEWGDSIHERGQADHLFFRMKPIKVYMIEISFFSSFSVSLPE